MYVPAPFAVDDAEAWALLAEARLGVLVTHGAEGLHATHLPFAVDPEHGRLLGHVARPNDGGSAAAEGLAIFQGPSAYVSPAWYAAKAEHGRVVPTWNYEAVHVRGRLRWFDDPAGLLDVVQRLTDRFEAGRAAPWSVADAPADYVERLMAGIVGVELTVTAIEGKRKLSQNRPAGDRARIVAGLAAEGPAEQALAARMSAAR